MKMYSDSLYMLQNGISVFGRQKLISGIFFTNLTKTIAPKTEIFQGMFDTIVNF